MNKECPCGKPVASLRKKYCSIQCLTRYLNFRKRDKNRMGSLSKCEICHRSFNNLRLHLNKSHGMDVDSYSTIHPETIVKFPDAYVIPNGYGRKNWNKIIPYDDLFNLVKNLKLSDVKIAHKYGCSQIVISRLRKDYKITTTKRYEKMCSVDFLTKKQCELIYGSLLGDASLTKNGQYYNFNFTLKVETSM